VQIAKYHILNLCTVVTNCVFANEYCAMLKFKKKAERSTGRHWELTEQQWGEYWLFYLCEINRRSILFRV